MGFDSKENAKKYTPKEGDTLASIAARERAEGNYLEWRDIALFNWGTEVLNEINIFLRDVLGARRRDANNNFIISANDEPKGELLIPLRYKRQGLQVNHAYTVKLKTTPEPGSQFKQCCDIPGVTFETDKSFIRPSVVDALKELDKLANQFPDAKIMIFGHTDKVGDEKYNKKLSERRAKSTYAFITQDVDTWEQLNNDENWGAKAIQEILKDFGGPYDPGKVDGIKGEKTEKAIKKYQEDRGLKVDGVAGKNTRAKMFAEYMSGKHDVAIDEGRFLEPKFIGCGECNPLIGTDKADEANRRVVFYLFNPDRPPKFPCAEGDINPCKKQMDPPSPRYVESFTCSFYDSVAKDCGCETKPAVVKPLAFAFLSPTQKEKDKPNKQYVNCATTNAGVDGNSNIVEITICAKAESNLRAVRNGDIAHIEVIFGRETGRDDPKPKLDVADAQESDGGKKFKGTVKFEGGNTTAKFKVDLGLAGSETCEVKIGIDESCSDAKLMFENWRKMYYQVTRPTRLAEPNFSGSENAFATVSVDFEKYDSDNAILTDSTSGMPPSAWVDGAIIESGKTGKVLVIGSHNVEWFKGRFEKKPDKVPAAHLIFCDYQLDAQTAPYDAWVSIDSSDEVSWPPGSASTVRGWRMEGSQVGDDTVYFEKALHDESDAVADGEMAWKCNEDETKKGKIPRDHIVINQPTHGNFVYIKMPAAAASLIDEGKTINIHVRVYYSQGWYNGWCTNNDRHNVIKAGRADSGINGTIVHEVGHALHQSAVDAALYPGLPEPPHSRHYTNDRGHSGNHCAFGIDKLTYDNRSNRLDTAEAGAVCTCVMYGAGTDKRNSTLAFCEKCAPYVKAVEVKTVTT